MKKSYSVTSTGGCRHDKAVFAIESAVQFAKRGTKQKERDLKERAKKLISWRTPFKLHRDPECSRA